MAPKPNFAALFDMDGLMVDTERIQSDAYRRVMTERYGKTPHLTEHGTVHVPGETTATTWRRLMEAHNFEDDVALLTDHKRQTVMEILQRDVAPMPGLAGLFALLGQYGVAIAVATSAQRPRAELILTRLGLRDEVAALVTANDVEHVKPAPDAYLAAAQRLAIEPQDCIVFEDSEAGVVAGKRAGAKVVAVPNVFTAQMDFSQADLVTQSLADVSIQQLIDLHHAS